MIETIKDTLLQKFEKALTMELPVETVVEIGKVVAMFEQNNKEKECKCSKTVKEDVKVV